MAVSSPQNKKNRTKGNRNSYVVGRFGIIFAITVFIAACISVMLVRTTVVNAKAWNAMGASTLRDSNIITPNRGEILAADGSILATNLYYFNVMVDFRATRFDISGFNDSIPQQIGRAHV